MISDTKFINRVLIDTSVEQRFKLIKKGFLLMYYLSSHRSQEVLTVIQMFKTWAKLCLDQFVPYTYEMRIKEKKCFTFVFAATISLFKSRLKTFLLS